MIMILMNKLMVNQKEKKAKEKIIVVENSNNVAFKKELEKKYKNLSCILTYSNLGFSKACNIGLKKIDKCKVFRKKKDK